MKLWGSVGRSLPTPEVKDAVTRRHSAGPHYQFKGAPLAPPLGDLDLDRALNDSWGRVMWVYRAIDARAKNAARLTVAVKDGRGEEAREIENHPITVLLNRRANPYESGQSFRYRLHTLLDLSKRGVYVEVNYNRGGDVSRLDLLNPKLTFPIPDPDKFVSGFEMRLPSGEVFDNLPPFQEGKGGVIWIRRAHPTDPYSSSTWLDAAGISIDIDHYARVYNKNFLLNDGRPGGILSIAPDSDMDPADAEILQARMSGGPGSAGRVTIMEGDQVEYFDTAINPREGQYVEARALSKAEILAAAGTPESLWNSSGRTYDNADAELEGWWRQEMVPEADLVASFWEEMTPGGIEDDSEVVTYRYDEIYVLGRDQRERETRLAKEQADGLISVDEYREGSNKDALDLPGTRVLWLAAGKAPVGDPADVQAILSQGQPTPGEPPADEGGVVPGEEPSGDGGNGDVIPFPSGDDPVAAALEAKAFGGGKDKFAQQRAVQHALVGTWEKALADELAGLFRRQQKVVLARLEGKARKHTRHWVYDTPPPVSELKALDGKYIVDRARWIDEVVAAIGDIVKAAYTAAGGFIIKHFDAEGEFEPGKEAEEVIAQTVRIIAEGFDARAGNLQTIVERGDEAGKSVEQIADDVREAFTASDTWSEVTSRQVVGAMNAAQTLAAKQSGAVKKRWLATDDERTRTTHRDAEGQVVDIDDSFSVGEAKLLFPGDPTGPVGEWINCRCTMLFQSPAHDFDAELDADMAELDAYEASLGEEKRLLGRVGSFLVPNVRFDPTDHPRDHQGRFIDTPDVRLADGSTGVAVGVAKDGTITVAKPLGVVVAANPKDVSDPEKEPSTDDIIQSARRMVEAIIGTPEQRDQRLRDYATVATDSLVSANVKPTRWTDGSKPGDKIQLPMGEATVTENGYTMTLKTPDGPIDIEVVGTQLHILKGGLTQAENEARRDANFQRHMTDPLVSGVTAPDLETTDYEGTVGDRTHVTRVQRGHLPTSAVATMPGGRGEIPGEHRNMKGEKWKQFKVDIAANGIKTPLFITVDHGEAPVISEGNHRRDAAVELGIDSVPVEIKFFGHAEQTHTGWGADPLVSGSAAPLPPILDLGEGKIPEGTVRLYHYTPLKNAEAIKREGLLEQHARGDGGLGAGNEPSAGIWASTQPPDFGADYQAAVVEFWAKPDQISERAESLWRVRDGLDTLDEFQQGTRHVIMKGDVSPEQFVQVHEPWQAAYRYMKENKDPLKEFAWVMDEPDEPPWTNYKLAYRRLQAEADPVVVIPEQHIPVQKPPTDPMVSASISTVVPIHVDEKDTTFYGTDDAKTEKERLTRCYELAGRAIWHTGAGSHLVHGTIQGDGQPRMGHAWVELPSGDIWEPVTTRTFTPAEWQAWASPTEDRRYSQVEAMYAMQGFGHYGPWHRVDNAGISLNTPMLPLVTPDVAPPDTTAYQVTTVKPEDVPDLVKPHMPPYIRLALNNAKQPENTVFVAKNEQNQVVGAISMVPLEDQMWVNYVGSISDGAGTELMRAAARHTFAEGMGELATEPMPETSREFYEKLGGQSNPDGEVVWEGDALENLAGETATVSTMATARERLHELALFMPSSPNHVRGMRENMGRTLDALGKGDTAAAEHWLSIAEGLATGKPRPKFGRGTVEQDRVDAIRARIDQQLATVKPKSDPMVSASIAPRTRSVAPLNVGATQTDVRWEGHEGRVYATIPRSEYEGDSPELDPKNPNRALVGLLRWNLDTDPPALTEMSVDKNYQRREVATQMFHTWANDPLMSASVDPLVSPSVYMRHGTLHDIPPEVVERGGSNAAVTYFDQREPADMGDLLDDPADPMVSASVAPNPIEEYLNRPIDDDEFRVHVYPVVLENWVDAHGGNMPDTEEEWADVDHWAAVQREAGPGEMSLRDSVRDDIEWWSQRPETTALTDEQLREEAANAKPRERALGAWLALQRRTDPMVSPMASRLVENGPGNVGAIAHLFSEMFWNLFDRDDPKGGEYEVIAEIPAKPQGPIGNFRRTGLASASVSADSAAARAAIPTVAELIDEGMTPAGAAMEWNRRYGKEKARIKRARKKQDATITKLQEADRKPAPPDVDAATVLAKYPEDVRGDILGGYDAPPKVLYGVDKGILTELVDAKMIPGPGGVPVVRMGDMTWAKAAQNIPEGEVIPIRNVVHGDVLFETGFATKRDGMAYMVETRDGWDDHQKALANLAVDYMANTWNAVSASVSSDLTRYTNGIAYSQTTLLLDEENRINATGGDRTIALWAAEPTVALLSHEMAHNIDTKDAFVTNDNEDRLTQQPAWQEARHQDIDHFYNFLGSTTRRVETGNDPEVFPIAFRVHQDPDFVGVTEYGASQPAEDLAESVRLYLRDRQNGRLGTAVLRPGNVGRDFRFADLFPYRARYLDNLFGNAPAPQSPFARRLTDSLGDRGPISGWTDQQLQAELRRNGIKWVGMSREEMMAAVSRLGTAKELVGV